MCKWHLHECYSHGFPVKTEQIIWTLDMKTKLVSILRSCNTLVIMLYSFWYENFCRFIILQLHLLLCFTTLADLYVKLHCWCNLIWIKYNYLTQLNMRFFKNLRFLQLVHFYKRVLDFDELTSKIPSSLPSFPFTPACTDMKTTIRVHMLHRSQWYVTWN